MTQAIHISRRYMTEDPTAYPSLDADISIFGEINDNTAKDFFCQLKKVQDKLAPIIVEISTPGGDPDIARRIGLELALCRLKRGRELYFIGKTQVYSCGMAIMANFPKRCRYLTADTMLLIHERQLDRDVKFNGPMRTNIEIAAEILEQFKTAQLLEKRDFEALAEGSHMDAEEVTAKAMGNWYLTADDALRLGLVQGVI